VWAEDTAGSGPPTPGTPRQEADFVKTDGYHVYVLNGNRLHVFGVPQFGQLVPESVTELEGWPTQTLVDKDNGKIAIFSQVDASLLPAGHPLRDAIGRFTPGAWRATRCSTSPSSTPFSMGTARTRPSTSSRPAPRPRSRRTAAAAASRRSSRSTSARAASTTTPTRSSRTGRRSTRRLTTSTSPRAPTTGGGSGTTPDDEDWTNVHAFDISKKGQTSYVGSGRVPGRIKDTFGLSEKDKYLRVATTTAREWWWIPEGERPTPENQIHVLAPKAGKLERVDHLGGIAPGESIFATRFVGDRAYVVTAKFIDPMFTIDFHDPARPRLLGGIEVPGVSTYVQSIGGGRLLTIGWGGDQNGINESKTQISLFDVSDDRRPVRVDTEALDNGGSSWTEALWEHKAFQYWAPKGLLAVPVSRTQSFGDARGSSWS
jgi:hypothetical protein